MDRLEFIWQLDNVNVIIETIERMFLILYTYYTYTKVINLKEIKTVSKIIIIISAPIISIITIIIKYNVNEFFSIFLLLILMVLINTLILKKDSIYNFTITTISLGINYILFSISIIIAIIPGALFMISNDYINLVIILTTYSVLMYEVFKIKKVKNGFDFLQRKLENTYINLIILNIAVIILFLNSILQTISFEEVRNTGIVFYIVILYMIVTIGQSFKLYYKQKQLIKDLEETKQEVENKNAEIKKLEKENLEFSKTSHSLAHKQRALEYKINQLMESNNQNEEDKKSLKEELENISKEMYKEPIDCELEKTEIQKIDNMLSYMQSECVKNNIKFELQISGNIHYMINHIITEDELEIMLADHIKDAIIAINDSDNTNKSILVRLGMIDGTYSLHICDSGIEFSREVLDKLGKEPITTHKDSGGTGMGFMNTFDVLNKYKASLIIQEIGEQSVDNYTKAIIIKFDNNNEFKIESNKEKVTK